MHVEAVNELLAEEVASGKIKPDEVASRLVQLITFQTGVQRQQNPQEHPDYWAQLLNQVKIQGYTAEALKAILELDRQDLAMIKARTSDPLLVAAFGLHTRIHTAKDVRIKINENRIVPENDLFLQLAVTNNMGIFNLVNAGCFVLEIAEAKSHDKSYKKIDFRATADEISLSLYQTEFPFLSAINSYLDSFHQNVMRPIGRPCGR